MMNSDYNEIKIRIREPKLNQITDIEAYEKFKHFFHELERTALKRFVILEKTSKPVILNHSNFVDTENTLDGSLNDSVKIYNKSFSKMHSCFVGFRISDLKVYDELISERTILHRFVLIEKNLSHGGTCPYDVGKEKQQLKSDWSTTNNLNVEIRTDIDDILERYNLIECD